MIKSPTLFSRKLGLEAEENCFCGSAQTFPFSQMVLHSQAYLETLPVSQVRKLYLRNNKSKENVIRVHCILNPCLTFHFANQRFIF